MSKFVGESEKNIRELFEPAIAEYRVAKENSSLHVIIFDEIDAVCR
jgi:vesicle-fusing ATPase